MSTFTYTNQSRGDVIRIIPCNESYLNGILERIKEV